MYTLIVYGGGHQVEALLLSATAERLRVVMPGRADTAEFRLIEGRWTSESGEHMELGAVLAADAEDARRVLGHALGRTRAAGGLN
jgi:hypothetical protein